MGLIIGLIKSLIRLLIYFTIFAAIIILIPNLPPYAPFTTIKLAPTQLSVGPLSPNGALNNAQQLSKDKLLGPEAFQLYNGEVYTSLATGEIVKVSPAGHVTFVTKIGQPCFGISQEHICGRPLGFQVNEETNYLYVADAYHGIWKVNLKTDKKQLLVSPNVPVEGRKPKLFNSLALALNGDVYWTDSSSDFHLKDGVLIMFTDPSGRLLYYNAAKNESKVLLDDLWFANSVVISPNHQFVLVSETMGYRVIKYYIEGVKKGTSEVFIDGLPGVPDNLRVLPDGSGVLLALYTSFDDSHPNILKSMSETPVVRKFLARILRLIEIPFEYLNNLYPHIILEEIIYFIGHLSSLSGFSTGMSGLVQLDWNGNVVASYFNTDGTLRHISDAIVYNGKLYTGSPHGQSFIGSVPAPPLLLKAFSEARKTERTDVPKDSKPTQQPPPTPKHPQKPVQSVTPKPPHKPTEMPKPATPAPEQKKNVVDIKPSLEVKVPAPIITNEQKATPEIKLEPPKKTPPPQKQDEPKLAVKSKSKSSFKPEAKPSLKPEAKPTPKPEAKPSPKPEAKPAPKPEAKPAPKPETKPASQPETKPAPKPEAEPAPKPEIKSKQKPETMSPPTPKPDIKPAPKPEVIIKSAPETRTTPMPKAADKKHNTEKPIASKQPTPQESEKDKSEQKPQMEAKQEIPIKEEIKSDTAKPNKGTLKVIKKGGPAEIPNPNFV